MALIEEALAAIAQRDKVISHERATPIALVGRYVGRMKGNDKVETDSFNPREKEFARELARSIFDESTANLILELSKENKLPAWILDVLDIEQVRLAATNQGNS